MILIPLELISGGCWLLMVTDEHGWRVSGRNTAQRQRQGSSNSTEDAQTGTSVETLSDTRMISIREKEIEIPRETIPFLIGKKGANMRILRSIPNVASIRVNDIRSSLVVRYHSDDALRYLEGQVQKSLQAFEKLHETKIMIDLSDRLNDKFKYKRNKIVHRVTVLLKRLRILEGVISIEERLPIVTVTADSQDAIEMILNILDRFKKDESFMEDEEIWNSLEYVPYGNFRSKMMYPADFIRHKITYMELDKMRSMPGIRRVDLVSGNNSAVVVIKFGADTENQLENCMIYAREQYNSYIDRAQKSDQSINARLCSRHNAKGTILFEETLFFPCGSQRQLIHSKYTHKPFLDYLFKEPEVLLIELDFTCLSLKVSCLSHGALERSVFLARGYLRLYNEQSWKKQYHSNYLSCIISIPERTIGHEAQFVCIPPNKRTKLSSFVNFIEFYEKECYFLSKVQPGLSSNAQAESYAPNVIHFKNRLDKEFSKFLDFSDFSALKSLSAKCDVVDTVYTRLNDLGFRPIALASSRTLSVHHILENWNSGFNTATSNELIMSIKHLEDFLVHKATFERTKAEDSRFWELRFSDLSNNQRYKMRYKGPDTCTYNDNRCGNLFFEQVKHLHYDTNTIKGFPAFGQKGYIESHRDADELEYIDAVDFARKSLSTGKAFKNGEMCISNRYSMLDVSFVTRNVYEKVENCIFKIHLDKIIKKTPNSFGKFTDYCSLTILCPRLDSILEYIQKRPEATDFKKRVMCLYLELFDEAELLADSLSDYIKSVFDARVSSSFETL